jgi:hypothetical protein
MPMVAQATKTSVTPANHVGTAGPRLSGGALLRRSLSRTLTSFARLDS